MTPLLSVDRLSVGFPTAGRWVPIVRGVSFELGRGEILGLVGESGCGKSVTARALVGLPPAPCRILEGEVRLDGERVAGPGPGRSDSATLARGRRIGLVFQEPAGALDPVFSIGSQLVETVRTHRGLDRTRARHEAVALLARVALADPERVFRAFSHQLSGGQRQRALIALALAGEPDVLVADEPTTALDVTIQAQILELLSRLRRELDLAVLLITHDLAVVAETCDRALVMYAGEVVEIGPVDRLFDRPLHPYTTALLAAVPRLGRPELPVEGLAGRVPTPENLPTGCVFHPRCPRAVEPCARRRPALMEVEKGRRAACLLLEETPTPEALEA